MRITIRPDRTITVNTKRGGRGTGRNVGSANWKRNGWESTSVTGAVVSLIAGEVVLRASDLIKQVRVVVGVTSIFS